MISCSDDKTDEPITDLIESEVANPPSIDGHYIIIPEGGTTADLTPYTAADIKLINPGYYLNANAATSGESRHDVSAKGKYSGGKWTVEFKSQSARTNKTANILWRSKV